MSDSVLVEPMDTYNEQLVDNARPSGWVNPEPARMYNLVVIGAGTAGLVTAAGAAGLGAKVALVERHLMGGDCLNVGCVPSKCIIRSSRVWAQIQRAGEYGMLVPDRACVDFPAVMERMRRLRSRISHNDSAHRFRDMGVDVFFGEGRFLDPHAVEVDGAKLRFRKAAITTGARAHEPPIEGLAQAGFLTNETVFSLTQCPRRLVVIGAGPLGCELAQAFQRLGARVTIIEKSSHPLPREDRDASRILADAFRRDGITLKLNSAIKRVGVSGNEKEIHVDTAEGEEVIVADAVLVGAGRKPNLEHLNLDAAGVARNEHGVVVNDKLRTTNRNVYAAGDVCMRYKFTHAADAAARIVIQNALFWGRRKASALTIPWCTYTDPEIAHVGMYERDAEDRGLAVDTFVRSFNDLDRAVADGEEEGFAKIHVKKGTDRIVGATIVASHAGEMISEITVAMAGKVGLRTISGVIHPYPTQAEAVKQLGDAYNRSRLTPFLKKVFARIMSWKRQ